MEITEQMIRDALRYMGIPKGKEDLEVVKKVNTVYQELEKIAVFKTVHELVPITQSSEGVYFEGTTLTIKSQDLSRLFSQCSEAYLLAATLGQEVDRCINLRQKLDMFEALVLDTCASVLVDKVCDDWEKDIQQELKPGEFLTMRFSPGYGDVSLECQGELLTILNTKRRIGLTLTQTNMLFPTKSITAFIGVSEKEEKKEKNCGACNLVKGCMYKRRGEHCGL